MSDLTAIFAQSRPEELPSRLLPAVYDELRQMARAKMNREQAAQTLQPTALVHEAWLRLVDENGRASFENRAHFFAAPNAGRAAHPCA